MSVSAITWAWSQFLPATAKLVLLALADHADDEGRCWPSLGRLEMMTGLNRSTITRALSTLDSALISRDRSDGGVGHSTRYQLHLEQVQSATVAQGNGCTAHQNSCTAHLKQVHSAPRTIIEPSEPSNKSPLTPACPHSEIIRIYHNALPELPHVVESRWSGSQGAKDLTTRWREDKRHQDLEFWKWLFEAMNGNRFWLGENNRGWRADLGWIVKRSNFDKIIQYTVNHQQQMGAVS
jgi:hypothetical protein